MCPNDVAHFCTDLCCRHPGLLRAGAAPDGRLRREAVQAGFGSLHGQDQGRAQPPLRRGTQGNGTLGITHKEWAGGKTVPLLEIIKKTIYL